MSDDLQRLLDDGCPHHHDTPEEISADLLAKLEKVKWADIAEGLQRAVARNRVIVRELGITPEEEQAAEKKLRDLQEQGIGDEEC